MGSDTVGHRDEAFFEGPRVVRETSAGPIELPVAYYESRRVVATFSVGLAEAEARLAGTPLRPSVVSGCAIASLAFFQYGRTSLGAYDEAALSLAVEPVVDRLPARCAAGSASEVRSCPPGHYILDLPVTTDLAMAAGRDIWGYPKFVGQIPVAWRDDRLDARVLDRDAEPLVRLSGRCGDRLPGTRSGSDQVTYSRRRGEWLRTRIAVRCVFRAYRGGMLRLQVADGEHRMARDLYDLGLADQTPELLQVADDCQSLLMDGEVL